MTRANSPDLLRKNPRHIGQFAEITHVLWIHVSTRCCNSLNSISVQKKGYFRQARISNVCVKPAGQSRTGAGDSLTEDERRNQDSSTPAARCGKGAKSGSGDPSVRPYQTSFTLLIVSILASSPASTRSKSATDSNSARTPK